MAEFNNRDMKVIAGGLEISARDLEGAAQPLLKMRFKSEADVVRSPNKIKLDIWNLSKDSRTRVQKRGEPIIVEAGYSGFTRVMFNGDVRFGNTVGQRPNWVTSIIGADGGKQYKTARVCESFAAGTKMGDVLKAVGEAMGVDVGNLQAKVDAGGIRTKLTEWTNGGTLTGKAKDALSEVAKSMGYQWSIQRGALLFLEEKETTEDSAIVLSAATGLIGSPEVGEDGRVTSRSLLNGDLFPGRRVQYDTREVSGEYRVDKAVHTGDTWGGDWSTRMETRPLG